LRELEESVKKKRECLESFRRASKELSEGLQSILNFLECS